MRRRDGLEASTISILYHDGICYSTLLTIKPHMVLEMIQGKKNAAKCKSCSFLSLMLDQPADALFVGKENKYIEM